jgi:hypothetical protein
MRKQFPRSVRWLSLVVGVPLLVGTLPARAAEVDKFLPSDAEAVVTINVRQILDSELVKKYGLEHLKQAIKSKDEVQQTLESLGLDPLKDIDAFVSASPGGADTDKGLFILHGKFDVAKFKAKGEEAAKEHKDIVKIIKAGDHTVYEVTLPQSPQTFHVAVVDSSTIVAAVSKEYVTDAFDKAAGKKEAAVKKEVRDLIQKADAKQSLWVAALGSGLAKGQLAGDPDAKAVLDKIKTLTGGVTVGDEVKAEFVIGAKSDKNAKELADVIEQGVMKAKGLLGFIAAQQKQLAPLLSVLETVKINAAGSDVTVKGEASKEVIEKALNK